MSKITTVHFASSYACGMQDVACGLKDGFGFAVHAYDLVDCPDCRETDLWKSAAGKIGVGMVLSPRPMIHAVDVEHVKVANNRSVCTLRPDEVKMVTVSEEVLASANCEKCLALLKEEKHRASYIGVPAIFNLSMACTTINQAYGTCYLVGSSLSTKNYRDVDVRVLMDDDKFDQMFPGCGSRPDLHARWSLTCTAISEWLTSRNGLPIDFQIQRRTEANTEFRGPRNALGHYFEKRD